MISLNVLIARGETLIFGRERQSSLRIMLIRGAAGTFSLKVASTGLSFLISLFLARLLGATGFGAYTYAVTWVSLLSVPAVLGLDHLLIRETAAYKVRSAWQLMRGLWYWSNLMTLFISLGLGLVAAICTWLLAGRVESQMVSTFWLALIMLPVVALTRLQQAAMQGLHHVVFAQLPEMLIRHLLFIVSVGAAFVMFGDDLTALGAVGLEVLAASAACLIGLWLLHSLLPQAVRDAPPLYQARVWTHSMLPLLFINVIQAMTSQVAFILLGMLKGAAAVGVYAVAHRGAGFIAFALLAVNAALSPTIASLYAARDMKRLQHMITQSARIISFLALCIAISILLFSHRFLAFFGDEFTIGQMTLVILCFGQFVNATMGSVGQLLIMTGHERDTAVVFGINAFLTLTLNAILIPKWGMEGAATATATSMIIWNILLAILVYKRIGIDSTALGKMSLWREP